MSAQITAFVFNKIRIEAELPFELSENCWLSKATTDQLKHIKEYLEKLTFTGNPYLRYEYDPVSCEDGNGEAMVHLPEDQWRYYVVSSPADGYTNTILHQLAAISEVPLDLQALTLLEPYCNWGHTPVHVMRYLVAPENSRPVVVTCAMIEDLRALIGLVSEVDNASGDGLDLSKAAKALAMFDASNLLVHHQDAQCLALFSIIEMLLTHKPDAKDPGDSITRQIRNKIPLINRRFDRPIDFGETFAAKPEKVWTLLYEFRSAIAHGGEPDFEKGLVALGSYEKALNFLVHVVKALIRHSLREPQLMRDLKGV
jgi:hypothetical protein